MVCLTWFVSTGLLAETQVGFSEASDVQGENDVIAIAGQCRNTNIFTGIKELSYVWAFASYVLARSHAKSLFRDGIGHIYSASLSCDLKDTPNHNFIMPATHCLYF